jgi:hypothetical protein
MNASFIFTPDNMERNSEISPVDFPEENESILIEESLPMIVEM